ncbi:hypothetical protein HK1_02608 [Tepidibacillus sp. HK-1]|nr:hypothetical protein HK1_02608 [Tepidibacillus sp. HK-1]
MTQPLISLISEKELIPFTHLLKEYGYEQNMRLLIMLIK